MIIQPSPVRSDEKIDYKFNKEQILATVNDDDELLFNLQNIETNKQYESKFPISNVKRNEDGTLEVMLVKYHGAGASEEERFSDPYEAVNEEFETDAEPIQLEELIIEEPEYQPKSEQRLEALEATMIEMLGGNL
ncbi:MAG: hypothetical protein L0J49_01785 [Lactococcus lactis]|nr:hypothetical protein [Lactococcus lactis]MDN6423785.1 hypothetical protein [Tetragenococcus koreensis]